MDKEQGKKLKNIVEKLITVKEIRKKEVIK